MNIQTSYRAPQHIKTHHVESSNLDAVGYQVKTETLQIDFRGGRDYQYFEVPRGTYNGLTHAHSKGRYFNAHIRDRFEYTRLLGEG